MLRKWFSVFMIIALCLGMAPASASAAQKPSDPDPFDAGPKIREMGTGREAIDASSVQVAAAAATLNAPLNGCVLDSKTWMSLDDYTGYYFFDVFDLYAQSDMTQIWVQRDLSWPAGDLRETPVVTCEQADYLLGEFDNNIYPIESSFFGFPDLHDGSFSLLEAWGYVGPGYFYDELGRQIVLVSNIEDENYYDSTYPTYIAGFYSPSFEGYFDRNVMSIDAYDWANRVGPDGTRPYLYEGIFAHEYQHLLHDDYDSDEDTWINEGMADLAMVLTGYGESVIGHLDFTAEHPENSLVAWEDQGGLEILADYGIAFLFQYYLMEQYGQTFIQDLFHNQENGISSVNSSLMTFASERDFAGVFHDWRIATLIDSKVPNEGHYWFKDLDFKFDIGTPELPNPEAFDTPGAPPWGSDYLWVTDDPKEVKRWYFDGMDYATYPTPWTSDGDWLWSGTGDLLDNWAIFETPGGGTLTFDTIWELEDYWDFGFVQVSTDGGYTWMSLEDNEGYSVSDYDPNAHPKVIANLPGLTSWIEEPVTLSYDLSAYAGMDILVGFRMVTDWATYYSGWWIDNVYVDSTLISDGTDTTIFKDITEIVPVDNDFMVTFVGIKGTNKGNQYKTIDVKLDDVTEEGWITLNSVLKWSQKAVVIVSLAAPEGFTSYGDYNNDFESTADMPLAAQTAKIQQAIEDGKALFLPVIIH